MEMAPFTRVGAPRLAADTRHRGTFVHGVNSRDEDSHHESECATSLFNCKLKYATVGNMSSKNGSAKRRSGCPLNASVEMLGDRWSLLIVRDMMLRGFRSYKEFLESYEGIATNILADRLRKLETYGIIDTERDPSDGRKIIYALTEKGIDLAPVMAEMVLWAAAHEDTANEPLVKELRRDKEGFIAAVRQRWAEKNSRSMAK